jgi:hypothetical protein
MDARTFDKRALSGRRATEERGRRCLTVTGRTIAENRVQISCNPDAVDASISLNGVGPGDHRAHAFAVRMDAPRAHARRVGSAKDGAVSHPEWGRRDGDLC